MIEKLKQKFNSLTKVFEILYVIEGVKPAARIMVYEDKYKEINEFLEKYKLYLEKSNFKVLKTEKDSFSNKGEKIKLNDKRKGHYFVYISKNKSLAKKAKEYEEKNDHVRLGLTLGYPKCCCEFFNNQAKHQEKRFNDYIIPALKASEGFIFPFQNNFAARYFDLSLLSHFPCNFNCKQSLEITKNNLKVIEKHSKEYALALRGMLNGAIIYTENFGVFLLRNSKIKGNEILYDSIIGNKDNQLSNLLKNNNKLRIINKHHIHIGNQDIETENLGVMFFI